MPSSWVSGVFLSVDPGKNCKKKQKNTSLARIWPSLPSVGGAPAAAAAASYRAVGRVVGPGRPIHAVLEFEFGDPEVTLGTTLDHYSRDFPNLVQIDLDPARRGCGRHRFNPEAQIKNLTRVQLRGYARVPEGIQQESPFRRALSGVLVPVEEEAESWARVTFPSSTPRPCRHTVGTRDSDHADPQFCGRSQKEPRSPPPFCSQL